jgi:hypothetical protein
VNRIADIGETVAIILMGVGFAGLLFVILLEQILMALNEHYENKERRR